MRTIYVDPVEFTAHTAQNEDNTRIPYETDFFDGKCDAFVEGFRCVPKGCSWVRSDGFVFPGDRISVWKPYAQLDAAQRVYEQDLIADMKTALNTLGVKV